MRKRVIAAIPTGRPVDRDWLDLDHIAVVEITSGTRRPIRERWEH